MPTAVLHPQPPSSRFAPSSSSSSHFAVAHDCPKCGAAVHSRGDEDGGARISELEAQVRFLTEKASAAADKVADYEDELRRLRAALQKQNDALPTPPAGEAAAAAAAPSSLRGDASSPPTASSRLPSFLSRKTSSSTLPTPPSSSALAPAPHPSPLSAATTTSPHIATNATQPAALPTATTTTDTSTPAPPAPHDLHAALTREQRLRARAETALSTMSGELEELSASLFAQANEMVATERRARARLEARVEVLERRDGEKGARLERLEGAVRRVERVRGLLAAD